MQHGRKSSGLETDRGTEFKQAASPLNRKGVDMRLPGKTERQVYARLLRSKLGQPDTTRKELDSSSSALTVMEDEELEPNQTERQHDNLTFNENSTNQDRCEEELRNNLAMMGNVDSGHKLERDQTLSEILSNVSDI